jgi:aspartyl/asparaginyl beta-hydroxylase (cupin superfamily)
MATKPSLGGARLRRLFLKPGRVALRSLNHLFRWTAGGEARPAFCDIEGTCPQLRLLDENYQAIREELESVLHYKDRIPRYHDISARERYISGTIDPDKDGKFFVLQSAFGRPRANQDKCPRTTALLQQIPNVIGAVFSILDPGKSIPAHCGSYHGYLRYHLGLRVPQNNPPSMRVKDQYYTWKEGQSIVFDDSWEHEVYNRSDDLRVVLLVDFLRPMSLPLHVVNRAIFRLASYTKEAKQAMALIEKFSGRAR